MTPHPTPKVGVLTIRAWTEPNVTGWRARITRSTDISGSASVTSVQNSVDDVCEAVREWLEDYVGSARR